MEATGIEYDLDKLNVRSYDNLLTYMLGYTRIRIPYGETVGGFADNHPKGIYLLRMDGHITTCIDGRIYDIWDCTGEEVTHCWCVA